MLELEGVILLSVTLARTVAPTLLLASQRSQVCEAALLQLSSKLGTSKKCQTSCCYHVVWEA